ncbi:hypothetical protein BDDG_13406 [Blastomyces dermatitidis ATCC 18188]|uniref:Uncharacterized protein n=1 Tax=Ajellomyces dermatitidis (strain ATCC 18188 / CBS 674.68) TaxID=653446 RepID=A0A0J9HJ75_AJEDA|nr:hypothetical protein BDDG_13406 [Blastomyces dermatitidis ATCC 18188]
MTDSIQSHSYTYSRSCILFTESVEVDDDSSHSYSASEHPSEAFESFIEEHPATLSQFKAGLNTASDTVRLAPWSTQQLDEAGSLDKNIEHSDVYHSSKAISDQQMKHLKMILEMNKEKQRNVNNHSVITSTVTWNSNLNERLKFNLYELNSCVGKTISQFKKDVKNTRNDRLRILYKEMMNEHHSETPEISDSTHSSQTS